jgi:chromosome segregation ATPase
METRHEFRNLSASVATTLLRARERTGVRAASPRAAPASPLGRQSVIATRALGVEEVTARQRAICVQLRHELDLAHDKRRGLEQSSAEARARHELLREELSTTEAQVSLLRQRRDTCARQMQSRHEQLQAAKEARRELARTVLQLQQTVERMALRLKDVT